VGNFKEMRTLLENRQYGFCVLIFTSILLFYYSLWVIVMPFVDEDYLPYIARLSLSIVNQLPSKDIQLLGISRPSTLHWLFPWDLDLLFLCCFSPELFTWFVRIGERNKRN